MASRIDVFPQLFFPNKQVDSGQNIEFIRLETAVSLQVESPKHFTFDPFVISS